jgi:hypothetical protein
MSYIPDTSQFIFYQIQTDGVGVEIESMKFIKEIEWQNDNTKYTTWLSKYAENRGPNLKSFLDTEIVFLDHKSFEHAPRVWRTPISNGDLYMGG